METAVSVSGARQRLPPEALYDACCGKRTLVETGAELGYEGGQRSPGSV